MLHTFVGPIDTPAAFVLVVFFAAIAAVAIVAMVMRQLHRNAETDHEFSLVRQTNENNRALIQLKNEHDEKIKQLDRNLITSHQVRDTGD